MFDKIKMEGKEGQEYINPEFPDDPDKKHLLQDLTRVNIFVGENNSGKSVLMRNIFSNEKIEFVLARVPEIEEFVSANKKLEADMRDLCERVQIKSIHEVSNIYNLLDMLMSSGMFKSKYIEFLEVVESKRFNIMARPGQQIRYSPSSIKDMVLELLINENIHDLLQKNAIISNTLELQKQNKLRVLLPLFEQYEIEVIPNRVYIPVLRNVRLIITGQKIGDEVAIEDPYKLRINRDYFQKANNLKIFTGQELFSRIRELLLGTHAQRDKVRAFEDFLSKNFFNSQPVTITPKYKTDVVHIKIGEGKDFPIHDLGEGVQAVILNTFPLFERRGQRFAFFFEEPDLYMHPGYQRIFIDTLLNTAGFEKFQYFITTHSNHFLDMTADSDEISVYSFQKKSETRFDVRRVNGRDLNVLDMLGVRNSSVFLSNATIWVEGITDRIYLRRYLELYMKANDSKKRLHEDLHYSFIEYGGGNITHWSFLDDQDEDHPNINVEALCGKLYLITDHDNATPGSAKADRLEQLKHKLGEQYHCLEAKEIENILSAKVLKAVMQELAGGEKINLDAIKDEEYAQAPIGTYLKEKTGIKLAIGAESGTLSRSYKVRFAKIAVQKMESWNDLSPEAKKLTEKLYAFLLSRNA